MSTLFLSQGSRWVPERVRTIFRLRVQPYLTPFNLTVGAVLGLITGIFMVVIGLAIIIATNLNVLGLIE